MGNTPNVRFKGFTEDWEQRKLGDLVIIERGGSPRPINKFITEDENGLNWVKIGDAPERGNYITQTKEKIRYEGLSKTREVHPGDLILSNSMSFGRPYIMAIDGCIHDGWLLIRDNEKRFDLKYLCYMLGTDMMLSQYKQMAAGSTVNNLNKELVGNTVVKYPSPEEQSKMGDYFSIFDNLITLHQQKCDETKEFKKYMLQNMFPQKDEKVPKIRFDGFTGDWEQRKFSELYARSSEKNDGSIGMDKNITVATMQFKNDVKVSSAEYLKTYYTFNVGDIAFEGHQSKEFRYGRFVENDIGNGIVSHIFAVFRPIQEYDLYFWKYAINNEALMQRILARSTKASTMMHDLVTNDFLNETFLVPSVDEQKQIGAFLNKLDRLITLHQQKCNALKEFKKYMLQNMFPQKGKNKCQN
jgi:type I restriction enzyme S subunit